jgi:concanavalin A-like lectin/glucanase superfamily protein
MARDFTGTGTFLREATNGLVNVSGTAITVHAFVTADTVADTRIVCRWGDTNSQRQFLLGPNASSKLQGAINDGSGSDVCVGATTFTTGVWHSCAFRKNGTGANALQVFLDGTLDGGITSNRSAQSLGNVASTQFRISQGSTGGNAFDGRIAEVSIWLVALTTAEIVALSLGASPLLVRPGSLYHYWPIWGVGSVEPDLAASPVNLTINGTPPVVNHAPVGSPFPLTA